MIRLIIDQSALKGGQRLPKAAVLKLEKAASKVLVAKGEVVISVAFVSDGVMKKWNSTYRDVKETTDVLSFPFEKGGEEKGEILLSYKQAVRQAKKAGHPTRHEVLFLLAHGILHIFGKTHETPIKRKRMFALQDEILKTFGITITL